MFNLLTSINPDIFVTLTAAIVTVGISGLTISFYVNRIRVAESARVQEGLPNEVTLTPEDFRQNPELVEIFEVTDVDNNLNLHLETVEHLEYLDYQDAIANGSNSLEVVSAILNHFS
jgi:hypothetical protein